VELKPQYSDYTIERIHRDFGAQAARR
jgi:hypothetical protein